MNQNRFLIVSKNSVNNFCLVLFSFYTLNIIITHGATKCRQKINPQTAHFIAYLAINYLLLSVKEIIILFL